MPTHESCFTEAYLNTDHQGELERAKGFEPSTPTLARLCSTPELHPLINSTAWGRSLGRWSLSCGDGGYMAQLIFECNREMTLRLDFFNFSSKYLKYISIFTGFLIGAYL